MTPSDGIEAEDTVVEVEFEVTNPKYPLVSLSEETGCEAELLQVLPRSDGAYTVFQRISDAPPERILEFTRSYDGYHARIVSDGDEGTIIEFRISEGGAFFTISLTDAGAVLTGLASRDGVARIVAEIPAIYSASEVIDCFQETYPSMEIVAPGRKTIPSRSSNGKSSTARSLGYSLRANTRFSYSPTRTATTTGLAERPVRNSRTNSRSHMRRSRNTCERPNERSFR